MSRCRIRGSNGDSHASISDLSSGAVLLKLFVMMVQPLLLLKAGDIFSLFTALNVVENKVLINLVFVNDYLKSRKNGVDKALRPIDNIVSNGWVWNSLHERPRYDSVRNSEKIHMYSARVFELTVQYRYWDLRGSLCGAKQWRNRANPPDKASTLTGCRLRGWDLN